MAARLTDQELHTFCEQFSILLHSGISAADGLELLADDSASPRTKKILGSLLEDMEQSGSLAHALEASGYFPSSTAAYVRVGEETGCLEEVMRSLAVYYEQEILISEQLRSAVTYPLLMLGMMAVVIVILLAKVLPVFQQVFRQMGMEMTGVSGGLLQAGTVLRRYSFLFFALLLLLAAAALFFRFHPVGRRLLERAAFRIPYFREIPLSMDYSRLAQSLSMGLRSGIGPDVSLELAAGLIIHPVIKSRLTRTRELLKEGSGLGEALTASGLFTGTDARLVSIGFHAGSGDEVMQKLSDRYQRDVFSHVSQVISIVEPAIVIVLSVLVGLVLLSVMMPLLGLLSEMTV